MKTLQDICKQLEPIFQESVDACRFEGAEGQEVINYKTFEKVMMKDGFILSSKTVEQKWKMLVASDVLKEISAHRALVNLDRLCEGCGYPVAEKKNKKINFSPVEVRA